jgi:glycosyltransferase involved in cell wall biosynthesis
MKKVCIIIPAYNEEKRISKTLEEYLKFFKDKKKKEGIDFEILVVINNTIDKTEEIVKKFKKQHKEINYVNFKQGGKGFAVVEGFKYALKKDFYLLGFVDADLATKPSAFYDLIKKIDHYDGAIASRYIKGAIMKPKPTWQRWLASRIFNVLIRLLLMIPYKDTQCGAKVFKKEAIKKSVEYFRMSQWAFDVDVLYQLRKKSYKIKEVPTVWSDKEYSHINLKKAGWGMFLAIVRLRLLNSPFKGFIRIYEKLWKGKK